MRWLRAILLTLIFTFFVLGGKLWEKSRQQEFRIILAGSCGFLGSEFYTKAHEARHKADMWHESMIWHLYRGGACASFMMGLTSAVLLFRRIRPVFAGTSPKFA